jgi:hypothetical protein
MTGVSRGSSSSAVLPADYLVSQGVRNECALRSYQFVDRLEKKL